MNKRIISTAAAFLVLTASQGSFAKTVVNVWYEWNKPFILDMAKQFNKSHPNIEVKVTVVGNMSDDPSKLMTAIAGGTPPNLILGWSDQTTAWASRGVIIPLDQFIKQNKVNLGAYAEASVKCVKYKGKVYGMPLDWDPDEALYINKRMFSEAGLDWTKPPVYTTDLELAAAKLTTRDANGKYSKFGWIPWYGWQFWQIYWAGAFGGRFYDDVKDTVSLNHPKNIEAYTWLGEYTKKYDYNLINAVSDGWMREKTAMMVGGDWMAASTQTSNKKLDFAIYKAPYPKGGRSFLASSGWAYMVPKGAKNLDATYTVMDWFSQKQQAAAFCRDISWLPANLEARKLPEIAEHPQLKWFVKLTEGKDDAIWLDPSPIGKTIWSEAEKAGWLVVQGKKTAREALDAAQKVAETDLKRALLRRIMN